MPFAEAAFAEIADLRPRRVTALLRDGRGSGFAALYRKSGLPPPLQPAFTAAVSASRETARSEPEASGARLSRQLVERVLSACAALPFEEAGRLTALLRRYEAEAARGEARELAGALADQAALAAVLEHDPETVLGRFAPDRLRDAA